MQFRFPGAARDFSPRVNFQCRLSYGVRTLPCAIACIYICAHVKDPVVRVSLRWIMGILKHPACTVGWVGRLCRSWLFPEKAARNSHGRNLIRIIQYSCTTFSIVCTCIFILNVWKIKSMPNPGIANSQNESMYDTMPLIYVTKKILQGVCAWSPDYASQIGDYVFLLLSGSAL